MLVLVLVLDNQMACIKLGHTNVRLKHCLCLIVALSIDALEMKNIYSNFWEHFERLLLAKEVSTLETLSIRPI